MKLIIISLLAIILLILLLNTKVVDAFSNGNNQINPINTLPKKRGLLLLTGECFREGGMTSRLRDTEYGLITQKIATESHINFVQYLKTNSNIDVEIVINTYSTPYLDRLKEWYNPYLVQISENNKLFKTQSELMSNSFLKLSNLNLNSYDFVLVSRCDICFKPFLYNKIFNPSWEKIMFGFHNYNPEDKCGYYNSEPLVNPELIFFPKKYYNILNNRNKKWDSHWTWELFKTIHMLTDNDMGFMIPTLHDSNTGKDKNPIYYMVSRPEYEKSRSI